MKLKQFLLPLTAFLAYGCSNEQDNDLVKLHVQNKAQNLFTNQLLRTSAREYQVRSMADEREYPEASKRLTEHIIQPMNEIDRETAKCIQLLSGLKSEILSSIGEKGIKSRRYSKRNPLSPARFDLLRTTKSGTTNSIAYNSTNGKAIRKSIDAFRGFLSSILAASTTTNERTYYFHDPKINRFADATDLRQQIQHNMAHVAPDDQEAITKIYMGLTHPTESWEDMLPENCPWIDAFSVLTTLELEILRSRADAIALISSRVGGEDSHFSELKPVVDGPDYVYAGSDIELKVFMAVTSTYFDPIVTITSGNAKVIKTANGQAQVQLTAKNPGKVIVTGTVTILNKSGIPKTMPWAKELEVID